MNPRQKEAKQKVRTKTISMSSMVGQRVGSFFMSVRTMNCSQSAFFFFFLSLFCFILSWLFIEFVCVKEPFPKHWFIHFGILSSYAFFLFLASNSHVHFFFFGFFSFFLGYFVVIVVFFFCFYLAYFGRATVKRFFLSSLSLSKVCSNVWLRCIALQINQQRVHDYYVLTLRAPSTITLYFYRNIIIIITPFSFLCVISFFSMEEKKVLRLFLEISSFFFFVSFTLLFHFMLHFIVIIISLNIRFDMYICIFKMICLSVAEIENDEQQHEREPSIDFAQTIGKYLLRWWLFIDLSKSFECVCKRDCHLWWHKKRTHTTINVRKKK